MGHQILGGLPADITFEVEKKLKTLFTYAITGVDNIRFARDEKCFVECLHTGNYDLVFCVDDAGMGVEYAEYIKEIGFDRILTVLIIPDRCRGDNYLEKYVNAGCDRFLFQSDLNVERVKQIVYKGLGSKQDTLEYLGLYFRPAPFESKKSTSEEASSSTGGTKVERKYLGKGIAVTRLCAGDAKMLTGGAMGEDEILFDLLSDSVDLELSDDVMPYKAFDIDEEWVRKFKALIREYLRKQGKDIFQEYDHKHMSRIEFEALLVKELMHYDINEDQARVVLKSYMKDLEGYGILDSVLRTEDITDVRLINKDTVNVQYKGVWYRTNITFQTDEDYQYFINRICQINKASINRSDPETIFTDISTYENITLRITVTHAILNTNGQFGSHIRIATRNKKTVWTLIDEKFMTRAQASALIKAVKLEKSILVVGGSGSGKTILLNMLLEYLPSGINGICIQESDELHTDRHPNIIFSHSLEGAAESVGEYSLKDLSTSALLKGAALFIIGEIKGTEAADFFTASRTCCVYTTTHAENCFGAIPRITELAKEKADYSQEEILRTLSNNIGYVVYCEKYKCKQIAKVVGFDEVRHDVIYDLYEFDVEE